MFCSRCGHEVKEGNFCPKCGAPVKQASAPGGNMQGGAMPGGNVQGGAMPGGNMQGGAMPGAGMTAAKKRLPYVAIGAIVLVVILLIVAVKLIFFRDNYEKPIENMVKVMEEGDAEAALELIPDKLLDAAEEFTGMKRDAYASMLEASLESEFDEYAGDIEIDYEIGDARPMTSSELNDIEDEFMGYLGEVEEGKEVEFSYEMYVDGSLEETEETTIEVIKLDGKWYVNPGDLF